MFSLAKIPQTKTAVSLSTLALLLAGATARAQVTYDAQIPFNLSGLSPALVSPSGVAVAPDGTIYLTDIQSATTGRVLRITPTGTVGGGSTNPASLTTSAVVTLAPTVGGSAVTLTNPNAVAVDSTGALYIADIKGHQVLKLANPETSAVATAVTYPGTENPSALAVDSSNNLYIADSLQKAIYEVTGGTATKLPISPVTLKPVGLAVDASGNVFFADALNNAIYKYTASSASTAALTLSPSTTFQFSSAKTGLPIGMGFDPLGFLYVLDSTPVKLWEISSAGNIYRVPFSVITTPGSLAVSAIGNLYLGGNVFAGEVDELFYNNNPVNFGAVAAGIPSPKVIVNYQFNTAATGLKFFQSVQGDVTNEFVSTSVVCTGTSGSLCRVQFEANYQASTPGLRQGTWGLKDGLGNLYPIPSVGISQAADLALYPGSQVTLSQTGSFPILYEPQGLAVTGNGGTLFVGDEGGILSTTPPTYTHGAVWAYPSGTGAPTKIGAFTNPMAIAVDAAGNLYVADYIGTVTKIPVSFTSGTATWPSLSGTPLVFPAGAALTHPMSLVFDPSGNLYIGDMGSQGTGATPGQPGYIVKVPANGGTPVKLNYTVGGAPVIFPQALATDIYGNLFIADGGDGQSNVGGVDVVTASGGTVSATSPVSAMSFGVALNQPSGLSLDAAGDLYILDGYNQRILTAQIGYSGSTPATSAPTTLLGQGTSGIASVLVTPSNLVVWPNGQYITVTDIGYQPTSGQSSPTQLITLQSTNSTVDASSGSASVSGVNVGNMQATFNAFTQVGSPLFSLSGCGSTAGTTLSTGIINTCTSSITYTGSGTTSANATFTLNGNASSDNSTLGNKILAVATPNVPVGQFVNSGPAGGQTQTATLTNIGKGLLTISNIQLINVFGNGGAIFTGGTCSTVTQLAQTQSCTLVFTFAHACYDQVSIQVTDNNDGTPGTVQSVTGAYFNLPACFGFSTPVGGGAFGGGTLSHPGSTQPQTGVPHTALTGPSTVSTPVVQPSNILSPGNLFRSNSAGLPAESVQPESSIQTNNAVQSLNGVGAIAAAQLGLTTGTASTVDSQSTDTNNVSQPADATKTDKTSKTVKTAKKPQPVNSTN
jgi:sugar lactone lactonase YvrE